MKKECSVAEARRDLPQLLHEVEGGAQVQITRRGEPVAVLISLDEYQRLAGAGGLFLEVYRQWEGRTDPGDRDVGAEVFEGLRDRSAGREVDL